MTHAPRPPIARGEVLVPRRLADLAARLVERITDPSVHLLDDAGNDVDASSLAAGAAGVALLHVVRARSGHGDPALAHDWLRRAVADGVPSGTGTGLHHGAPALAFVLHEAADEHGAYARALDVLDDVVLDLTRRRLDAAHQRIDQRQRPGFAEYDVLHGLTGLGAHHLRRHPLHPITSEVLTYLVRLTLPVRPGDDLPGWWTHHGPHRNQPGQYLDGHANLGMAHGITGPLALLAIATLHGVVVDGQQDAIERICAWLDVWPQDSGMGHHWPEILTSAEHREGDARMSGPHRPSWCYGTPGIVRAQQLAALASGDGGRRRIAEKALLDCLCDPVQTIQVTEYGLCHGLGGFLLTVWRVACDGETSALADALGAVVDQLVSGTFGTDLRNGFLDGAAGLALALHTLGESNIAASWDRCLVIA